MNRTTPSAGESRPEEAAETTDFSYAYSARQHKEIEAIRSKYLPPEENKLEQLHRLDRQAERPGTVFSILAGTISTLLLGIGMVLTMVYTQHFVAGIVIGLLGILGVALAYPLYLHITKRERARIAPEILRLADELIRDGK